MNLWRSTAGFSKWIDSIFVAYNMSIEQQVCYWWITLPGADADADDDAGCGVFCSVDDDVDNGISVNVVTPVHKHATR